MPSRNHDGRQLSVQEIADIVHKLDPDGSIWSHTAFVATMLAESNGYEWIRPIVDDPGQNHHLSVDRGICQLNSFWWDHVSDAQAYDAETNIFFAIDFIKNHVEAGTMGARPWKWSPILEWQWHGYGSTQYHLRYQDAYKAVIRAHG